MRRSTLWPVLTLSFLGFAWVGTRQTSGRPTSVPLAGTRELRVLKASVGTNHILSTEALWKQCLRRIIPQAAQKALGPSQEHLFQTRHESLVVWLDEFDTGTGRTRLATFNEPEAVMAGGTFSKGRSLRSSSGVICVEFPCFARDVRQIPLRVRDGTNFVRFTVIHPRPSRPAVWVVQPLPQTNRVPGTEIVLKPAAGQGDLLQTGDHLEAYVRGRALGQGRSGWMSWRMTAFDPWGNWTEGNWSYSPSSLPRLPLLPSGSDPWMLLVEGREYISAGFVPQPTNGNCVVLPLSLRAHERGLRLLLFAAPGSYHVTNGIDGIRSVRTIGRLSNATLILSGAPTGTNWELQLTTAVTGLLCLSDLNAGTPVVAARLRERIGADQGRIFRSHRAMAVTNAAKGSQWVASFFAPSLPDKTTNLEVEVVATLPPAEFFVSPPKRRTANRQWDRPIEESNKEVRVPFVRQPVMADR